MKTSYLLFILLFSITCFGQNNKGFKRTHVSFQACEHQTDTKKCFDDIIISKIVEASKEEVIKYLNEHQGCNSLSLYVSFVIDEKGRPIPESIRTTKNKVSDIDKHLYNSVVNLPKMLPLINEYDNKILSYYALFLDVGIKNNEIVILDKRKEPKEFGDDSCCTSPIYKGCNFTSNKDLKKCFSNNVSKIVSKKFNSNKALKGFSKKGTFNTFVLFKIDKTGEVIDMIAFGPTKNISNEAKRALGKIKRLKPGTVNGESVVVSYMLPIKFKL